MADGGREGQLTGPGPSGDTSAMLVRLRRRNVRDTAIAWVLAALAFRALVPAGFMFGSGEGHTLTVELCHGAGSALTVVHYGDDGRPLEPRPDSRPEGQCPFAATALLAPPPVIPVAAAIHVARDEQTASPDLPQLPQEPSRLPGARAPPFLT